MSRCFTVWFLCLGAHASEPSCTVDTPGSCSDTTGLLQSKVQVSMDSSEAPSPEYTYKTISQGKCSDDGYRSILNIDDCKAAVQAYTGDASRGFRHDQPEGGYQTEAPWRPHGCTLHSGRKSNAAQFFPKATGACGVDNFHCLCRKELPSQAVFLDTFEISTDVHHWRILVGTNSFEIVVDQNSKQKLEMKPWTKKGPHALSLGSTTKPQAEIEGFAAKWVAAHPDFDLLQSNCQTFVVDFVAFLFPNDPSKKEQMKTKMDVSKIKIAGGDLKINDGKYHATVKIGDKSNCPARSEDDFPQKCKDMAQTCGNSVKLLQFMCTEKEAKAGFYLCCRGGGHPQALCQSLTMEVFKANNNKFPPDDFEDFCDITMKQGAAHMAQQAEKRKNAAKKASKNGVALVEWHRADTRNRAEHLLAAVQEVQHLAPALAKEFMKTVAAATGVALIGGLSGATGAVSVSLGMMMTYMSGCGPVDHKEDPAGTPAPSDDEEEEEDA